MIDTLLSALLIAGCVFVAWFAGYLVYRMFTGSDS